MTAEPGPGAGSRPGRRTTWTYGLVSLLLATIGVVIAVSLGADGWAVGLGAYGAWLIQIAAFRYLARALAEGRPVLRPWIAGIAARAAGLALAFALSATGALDGDALLLSYGGGILGLLLLEAGWLAASNPGLMMSGRSGPANE